MKEKNNNDSSAYYSKRIKISVFLTLLLFIVLFVFNPALNSTPFTMKDDSKAVVLQPIIDPLRKITDIRDIPKQSLPKKIIETDDANKVTEIDINTSFEDSVIQNNDNDNIIYTVYETAPKLLNSLEVVYPEMAKKMGIEGNVFLRMIVEKDGSVSSVEILKSDNMILNESAVSAAKNLLFSPAMTRDMPVRCVITLPIIFRLTK
jgi:TonB family protein